MEQQQLNKSINSSSNYGGKHVKGTKKQQQAQQLFMLSQDKINSMQQFILNNQPGVQFKNSQQFLASSQNTQSMKKNGPSKSIRGVDKLLNASLNQQNRSKSNGRSSN